LVARSSIFEVRRRQLVQVRVQVGGLAEEWWKTHHLDYFDDEEGRAGLRHGSAMATREGPRAWSPGHARGQVLGHGQVLVSGLAAT
jgi:hypothetical protein